MMKLTFTQNWNNKLDCTYFTTLRANFDRYQIGQVYEIYLKGAYCYDAICLDIKLLKTEQINNWIALLDSGLPQKDFVKMVTTMYKDNDTWKLLLLARCNEETAKK